jgi:hypothetical protein
MEERNNILKFILLLILISAAFLSCNKNTEQKTNSDNNTDNSVLIGNWLRTDSDYRINISGVNEDFTLETKYFNPNPINIGKANWEESYGNLKIIIELRDVNYPGSTYRLSYLPDRDVLAGEYYQAVEGLTFYVEFARYK